MIRKLMLDSGAFSVWNKGFTINLDDYIWFCIGLGKGASYFVNLDVIPGVPRKKRTVTPEAIEASAQAGWDNYQSMLGAGVPKDKLIPVYHQHEKTKWLVKYLEFGSPYIGISPANDMSTQEKMGWMGTLTKHLFDGAGRPLVKTHGFAVTSYRLMRFWEWYSVDSKSWKDCGSWGSIYVPVQNGKGWDFSKAPLQVQTSPVAFHKARRDQNIASLMRTPNVRRNLLDWLDYCDVKLGDYVTRKENTSYSLKPDEEYWFNKKQGIVLETKVKGVVTHFEERIKVNAIFMKRTNVALKDTVKDIYFAGAPVPDYYNLEDKLGRRLLTFNEIRTCKEGKGARRSFDDHVRLLGEQK